MKAEYGSVEILSNDEKKALRSAAVRELRRAKTAAKIYAANRDLAMIDLADASGASGPELCSVRAEDVDLTKRLLRIGLHGGRRSRSVPIPKAVIDQLAGLVETTKPGGFLFRGPSGGRLNVRTFQLRLRRLGQLAGIAKPIFPHLIRHTHAATVSLAEFESRLGVRDVQSTLRHFSHGTANGFLTGHKPE